MLWNSVRKLSFNQLQFSGLDRSALVFLGCRGPRWGHVTSQHIEGVRNERKARPFGATRTANRRVASTRLRQRRDCSTTQYGSQNREGTFQPAVSAIWNHERNQASETRDTLVSEAIMFGGERYGKRVPSERESRVIELVAQGLKNKEVADEIGTTEHVVKNYLRVIYDKLGLWNRVELALWYEARKYEQVARA